MWIPIADRDYEGPWPAQLVCWLRAARNQLKVGVEDDGHL